MTADKTEPHRSTRLHGPLFFSALDKYLSMGLTVAMTIIAARVLTPDEIGVVVVSTSVAVLAETLRDFGASVYIVQHHQLSREGIRTAFTVMLGMSAIIAIVLLAAAAPVANFYADARLTGTIQVSAITVLFSSFAAPALALLRRDLNFRAIAVINVSGIALNLAAFLGFYALGLSYLSLVLASAVYAIYVALAANLPRPKLWIFRPCLDQWRQVLSFGGYSSATVFINNLYAMLPQLLLGRLVGMDASGLYNRATMICQLPDRAIIGAFQPVILPAFAAEGRAGNDLRRAYLNALSLLSAVQWPVLLTIAIFAEPVIRILLGDAWHEAAPLLRVMALASLVMAAAPLTFPILVSLDRVQDTLKASLLTLPVSACIVAIAATHSALAVAASMFVTLPLQVVVVLVMIRRRTGFSWMELAEAVGKSAICALSAAMVPLACAMSWQFRPDLPLPLLALALIASALTWLAALYFSQHPLWREISAVVRHLRQRATATARLRANI